MVCIVVGHDENSFTVRLWEPCTTPTERTHPAVQDVYIGAACGYTETPAGKCSFSSSQDSVMQGDSNTHGGNAEKNGGAETRSSLLAAAQLADPEAWRAIVYLYSPLVLGWCRRCGVHEVDAEDVAQEVFQ